MGTINPNFISPADDYDRIWIRRRFTRKAIVIAYRGCCLCNLKVSVRIGGVGIRQPEALER